MNDLHRYLEALMIKHKAKWEEAAFDEDGFYNPPPLQHAKVDPSLLLAARLVARNSRCTEESS